ncbi:TrkA-C domain-containing protein [Allopseudospirillum japonicum]|uniref:TrkA-C domain-containing protein n=1 Tax=Allopseudospirillum japonicum TaxID=64971 RepID=A0A1H6QBB1_9GAMM|nr:SLC13 family permease [Allopseudospirillum japonicum]SEI38104.1 TrkA-C domain-containing protein [Allopseudospirillum japonicum]
MEWQGWFTLGVVAATLVTLIVTRLTPDLVLMAALTLLSISGILSAQEAFAGFANTGLITVALMFVIAAGIRASGGVDLIVNHLLGRPKSARSALSRLVLPVLSLSGFMNNTPVVATMIPAVTRWCKQIKIAPSHLMIPLSYASILGGTLTLIGTSTNLVVNAQYQSLTGANGFALFDITLISLPVALLGAFFIIIFLPRFLPHRKNEHTLFANPKEFTFEAAVAADGPLVGKSVAEAGLRHHDHIYLVEIERQGSIVTAVPSEERLQAGDRLVFVGQGEAIMDILRIHGLVASDSATPVIEKDAPERRLVEAVVSPHCDSVGCTVRNSRFRDRYGAVVLAVARNGEAISGNLGSITLQHGDLLLLEARPAFITRQRVQRDFLLVNDLQAERPNHARAKLAWGILISMILTAATGLISMLNAALVGAGLMIITQCCTLGEARRSLDLTVLVTIGASFALGSALQKTGAAAFIGEHILLLAGEHPWLLLALTYISVSLLTEMVTNNAAAVLMLPITLSMTSHLGLNAEPFVLAIMLAASASFATPLGYQTNLMVYGPGGYRFSDFLRAGLLMNLLCALVTLTLLPLLWPLTP